MQPDHNINWALCFRDYHRWTIKRLHNYSLCLTISDSSKVRSQVSPYLVSSLLLTNPVYSLCVIATSWSNHAPAGSVTIPPSGPQSIYPSHGQTNPAIDQSHQPTPFRYPRRYTFMIALLRCDGWCSQSTLQVVVIKKQSHSHKEWLQCFIIIVM